MSKRIGKLPVIFVAAILALPVIGAIGGRTSSQTVQAHQELAQPVVPSAAVEQVENMAQMAGKQAEAKKIEAMAFDEVAVQNAVLVVIARDVCGFRVKHEYQLPLAYIQEKNPKGFLLWRFTFAKQIAMSGDTNAEFCRKMRRDELAMMFDF
jgi:hypothetical protein